jgi:hypothetical protein
MTRGYQRARLHVLVQMSQLAGKTDHDALVPGDGNRAPRRSQKGPAQGAKTTRQPSAPKSKLKVNQQLHESILGRNGRNPLL